MITNFFKLLNNLPIENHGLILGYSDEEINKIERLYDIVIEGECRLFMKKMGRSDGGLIGDDPIILYRELWSVRGQILFQLSFLEQLHDLKAFNYLKKPFVFSCEYETQYYFLQTKKGDNQVYHFDEITNVIQETQLTFSEYLLDVFEKYKKDSLDGNREQIICRGELLIC